MVNKLVVQSRLALINDHLSQLRRHAESGKEQFVEDKDKVAAVESYLRRSLEAVFDVGRHILAKNGGTDLAAEYKGIAKGLGEKKIISRETADTLVEMAGYRNRLVHLYLLIQNDELYDILQTDLGDIERFVNEINQFLAKK